MQPGQLMRSWWNRQTHQTQNLGPQGMRVRLSPNVPISKVLEVKAMKMYILVRDDVPLGFAMVGVAHASLAAYLKFQHSDEMKAWLDGPFFKAVCTVNAREFENAKLVEDHVILTESALDNREIAIAFKPREEWPKTFKFLKLYRE
jgi:hypothetical protein